MAAIIYALCCLGFAAVNDFVFKLFANRSEASSERKSCGTFVTIVGLTEVIILVWLIHDVENWRASIIWGTVGGLLSVVSNILLIESMRFLSAGISSTIFRLNMVMVVIGGCLFFNERRSPQLFIGIIVAALAVIAFIPRKADSGSSDVRKARLGFVIALVACFLRALMALSYKGAFSNGGDVNVVSVITGLCWVVGGPVFSLFRERRVTMPTKGEWLIGIVSGILVCGILFFMARMNKYGNASVVNPIAQMSFLGTFVLSVVFLHEKMTLKNALALALGCAAIVCLILHNRQLAQESSAAGDAQTTNAPRIESRAGVHEKRLMPAWRKVRRCNCTFSV